MVPIRLPMLFQQDRLEVCPAFCLSERFPFRSDKNSKAWSSSYRKNVSAAVGLFRAQEWSELGWAEGQAARLATASVVVRAVAAVVLVVGAVAPAVAAAVPPAAGVVVPAPAAVVAVAVVA